MIVRFHPEADRELHESLEWFKDQRQGLESEFMRCIDEAISRILANPETFPIALKTIRNVLVKRFPYIIYYEVGKEEIKIIAVFHTKRNPQWWKKRK